MLGSSFITKDNIALKDAIDSILKENSQVRLDCNRMSVAIAYSGLSNAIRLESLQKMFSNIQNRSNKITLGTWGSLEEISIVAYKYYEKITNVELQFCLPGDIVYFRNDPDYKYLLAKLESYVQNSRYKIEDREAVELDERFNSGWAGEFCICTGIDKFAGFGLGAKKSKIEFSSEEIRKELLSKTMDLYNLIEQKAKPILPILIRENKNKSNMSLSKIFLNKEGYRVNTSTIIKNM